MPLRPAPICRLSGAAAFSRYHGLRVRALGAAVIIPRQRLTDPDRNGIYVVPAIGMSFYAFAYSEIYGAIILLVFYALWLPFLVLSPEILTRGLRRVLPLLVLPVLAILSTLWSDLPAVTLRAGIQFFITVISGLIAARLTSIPNLALGGVIAGLLILIYSFVHGTYAYDVVDGSFAFAGAFASKNQLGYFASLTIIFALAIVFLFIASIWWRMLAVAVAVIGVVALDMTQSATSVLTLLLALVVIVGAYAVALLPGVIRGGVVLIVLCALAVGLAAAVQLDVFAAVFEAFGKDTTLTGRTYLWNQGIEFGAERPGLGLGYYAFWSHGRPLAEELWHEFYIDARTGFHFHNTLIEAYVALGLAGVAVVGAMTLALLFMPLRVIMNREQVAGTVVCIGLALLYIPRSFVEIDFFTPHTVGAFLVPFLILHMADRRAAERARQRRIVLRRQSGAALVQG